MAKLKVYRTAIGFHDAYVAAASQKAALAAWGSDKDLFARGAAELVTDPALAQEPLASPGTVIKRLRGTADEQMAALPPDLPRAKRGEKANKPARAKPAPPPPAPPPSRAGLEKAEAAVEAMATRHRDKLSVLATREAELARERQRIVAEQAAEEERLTAARDEAAAAYDAAVRRWRAG